MKPVTVLLFHSFFVAAWGSHKSNIIQQIEELLLEFMKALTSSEKYKNSTISTEEQAQILTDEELQDMIDEVDDDGDGTLDFPEFLNTMENKTDDSDNEENMREAFWVFDKDGNGYISAKELHHVQTELEERLKDEMVENEKS